MLIGEKYAALIAEREKIEGDIDYDSNPIIKEMIDLLAEDINATVSFLNNECSESQFIWMSEIFDEIAEKTKSKDFIEALRRVAKKHPEAVEKYNLEYFIASAEEYIE